MKLMIIGCGGVATVAIYKCCENPLFTEILLASRTVSKCDALAAKLKDKTKAVITTATVDADSKESLVKLMKEFKPHTVLNVALPYQDLTIMDACLEAGANYVDTANYEAEAQRTPNGERSMRSAAKRKALPLISITAGSGHMMRNSRRPVLPLCWEPALIPELRRFIRLMP